VRNNRSFAGFFILATVMAFVSGCGITKAIQTAETPNQKAGALLGTWNIILEDAVAILENDRIPNDVAAPVNTARIAGSRIAKSLAEALIEYEVESAKFFDGQTTAERVDVAAQNLERWYASLRRVFVELAEAIATAKGGTASILELPDGSMYATYSVGDRSPPLIADAP